MKKITPKEITGIGPAVLSAYLLLDTAEVGS